MADPKSVRGVAVFTCKIHPTWETKQIRRPIHVPEVEGETAEETMARLKEEAKRQVLPHPSCSFMRLFLPSS